MFPDGATRRAVSHGRRDAVVLPRGRALPRRDRRRATPCVTLLPKLADIVAGTSAGTQFGIGVDPADGLLRQGEQGYQLTWMDAKVDDWVVTPRRGKAVEINALWYNALRLLDGWVRAVRAERRRPGPGRSRAAARASRSTGGSGSPTGGYLYDVVDGEAGDDPACRPNQVFAISLDHPVLDRERWEPVLEVVRAAAAHAGRAAVAGAGPSGLQAEVLRRSAIARRGLPPGNRLGLADWAVRRCLAEGCTPRTRQGARHLLDGFAASPVGGVCRVDQRDLRRRSRRTLPAAASRRPGASPKCCDAWTRQAPFSAAVDGRRSAVSKIFLTADR